MNTVHKERFLKVMVIISIAAMLFIASKGYGQTTPQQSLEDGKEISLDCHYMGYGEWGYDGVKGDSSYVVSWQGFQRVQYLFQRDCMYSQWEDETPNKVWWVPTTKYEGTDCWSLEKGTRVCFNYNINKIAWYSEQRKDGRFTKVIFHTKIDINVRDND